MTYQDGFVRSNSWNRTGRKLALASATSLLAFTASVPALAQTAESVEEADAAAQTAQLTADEEAIVITGIRGSLQRNLNIKRNSPGVVDAISSEDIGKFPDSNVASALQRLPGVSIQRSGSRGEATGITIRGFGGDFNETLYDGRRISTASGGRSVDFSTVGADFIGRLTVLKTPDVTLSSNSIGATINVAFPKPFDNPGLRVAATASGSLQDRSDKITPTLGLLVSNTFANDTLGILGSLVFTERHTESNRVYVSGWPGGTYAPCQLAGSTAATCNPTDDASAPASDRRTVVGWFEQQMGASQIHTKDKRIDGRIALQWQPSDAVLVTLDDNYSRQKIRADNFGFGIWFNQTSLRGVELDENGTTVDFSQTGSQTDFTAGTDSSVLETNQTGLNVKWDATSNLRFEVDASYAKSWLNPDDELSSDGADVGYGFGIGPALGIRIEGDSDSHIPVLHDFGAGGDPSRWADTSVMGSHVTVRMAQKNTDVLKQFRVNGAWEQDDFSIQFGARYLEDRFKFQNRNTFANNFWQAYSGYGPASGSATGVAIPPGLFTGTVSTDNFIPGFSGSLPPVLLRFTAQDYQAFLTGLGNPQTQNIPGFNYSAPTVGTDFTGEFELALDPGSVRDIRERTISPYVRANFLTEIAGMPFHFNAGLRTEITKLRSIGIGRAPVAIIQNAGDPTLLTVTFSESQNIAQKSSYSYLLPSVDMKLELTPELHLRLDASRTLTRPGLNLITPVLNIGSGQRVGALTASGGNPNLEPYLSDNYDAALEWYYQPNSYAAVNVFLKHVSNFIVAGTARQTLQGVIDPSTGQDAVISVSSQINGPDATVRGLELALQHVFGDTGFGFNANATFVDTNRPYDPDDISQSGFAVTGLANSANFVGFYDKHGFEARVAINWRDEYLLQFGQNQNTGAFGAEPTFVNQSTQIDFSTSYQVTDQFNVFFQASNITNETMSTHGRYKNQLLDAFRYGRRFTAGVRFRL